MSALTGMAGRTLRVGRIVQAAIIALGIGAIGAAGFFGSQLLSELPGFLAAPVDNTQWNATQIEGDAARLQAEIDLLMLAPDRPLDELRLRYDLFYSRADVLIQQNARETDAVMSAWPAIVGDLVPYLERTTPLIDGSDARLRALLPMIAVDTDALRLSLRHRVIDVIADNAAAQDQQRQLIAKLSLKALQAAVIVVVALVLLLGLVYALGRIARRQASAIIRSSARWQATVAASPDAILVTDSNWRIIDYNQAAGRFINPDGADAMPGNLTAVVPDLPEIGAPGAATSDCSGGLTTFQHETVAQRHDVSVPVEISMAAIPDTEAARYVVVLRDISRRKVAEQQMIAARDAALQADRAKSAFLAVISHEMRTPLNGLLAALEIVTDHELPEGPRRFVTLAQEAGNHLLRHVSDVLDFSTIESGRLSLAPRPVELAQLLSDIVLIHMPDAVKQGTRLVLLLPDPPLPMVQIDPQRVTQVIQNLLTNAIKATAAGTITVELTVDSLSATQARVAITVTDSGIGIDKADQQRIFDDFVMIDASYRRQKDGTGLGLAIVRRLVSAMGGTITVDSANEAGASFRVTLPLPLAVMADSASRHAPPRTATPAQDILVIDDNAINRTVLDQMLRQMGHRVVLAESGFEGVRKAAQTAFDTILMDISMPGMDGIEATTLIRRDGASATSRILALTAHSTPEAVHSFMDAGMDGHLAKPVSRINLTRALVDDDPEPEDDATCPLDADQWRDLGETLGQDGRRALVEQFSTELHLLVERLRLAVAENDPVAAGQLAHDGAGMAGFVGAAQLAAMLRAVEDRCEASELAAAAEIIGEPLELVCKRTQAALAQTAK